MDFVTEWLWHLLAFALGSLVAYVVAAATIKPTNENEAFADVPETRAIGDR